MNDRAPVALYCDEHGQRWELKYAGDRRGRFRGSDQSLNRRTLPQLDFRMRYGLEGFATISSRLSLDDTGRQEDQQLLFGHRLSLLLEEPP